MGVAQRVMSLVYRVNTCVVAVILVIEIDYFFDEWGGGLGGVQCIGRQQPPYQM